MKKKADKPDPKGVNININLFSNITLDGKNFITLIILTLVISICDPIVRAELIRILISVANGC